MPSFGGAHCCLPLRQPSWVRSLLRKKVSIEDLPEDLLLDILSLVPRKDLVFSCRRVCSRWRDLVDLPILWKRKCRRMGFCLEGSDSGLRDWRTFCFHHSLRNLVKNPCGEDLELYERGLKIPRPPLEIQRCFLLARSLNTISIYRRDYTKGQQITLVEEGYSNRLMDESRPKIIVKDWQYFSFKSHCQLDVKLLSAGLEVLQECSLSHFGECGVWKEVSHTFEGYPPGVRHISLQHEVIIGAGDYAKITGTSVTIDPEGTQEEAAATTERSRFPSIFSLCLPATS
ncbi:F-box only protein 44-like isoform X2 [Anolis sagrei]|uniref:F-box only protein 44-like isoform X2 n=1 Tax=Anolis sagrei TaxID=38937 RepID=UPI00351FAEC8